MASPTRSLTRLRLYMSCRRAAALWKISLPTVSTNELLFKHREERDSSPPVALLQELVKALDISSGNVDVQGLVQPLRRLLRVSEPQQQKPAAQPSAHGKGLMPEHTLVHYVNGCAARKEIPGARVAVAVHSSAASFVQHAERRSLAKPKAHFL